MHRKIERSYVLLAVCAMLSGLPSTAFPQGSVRAAIEAGNKRFEQAISRGDAPGVGATYAENAKIFPANGHVVSGRAAITHFWQEAIDSGLKAMKLTSVEVEAHGDTAYEVGKWSVPGEDSKMYDAGDYLVVWKRVNGQWKLYRDIWT